MNHRFPEFHLHRLPRVSLRHLDLTKGRKVDGFVLGHRADQFLPRAACAFIVGNVVSEEFMRRW